MNELFEQVNDVLLRVLDPLLNWLLYLPADAVLLAVAIGTSAILVFVRLFTTNQDLLRRCRDDKKRLNELIKEAKKAGDKEALKRYRATVGLIAGKSVAAEGKPLLASILPIALLATWAFSRIAFFPPQPREEIEVRAYFQPAATGDITYLLPQKGLDAENGWVRRVVEDPVRKPDGSPAAGMAVWKLKAAAQKEPYKLVFRNAGKSYEDDLLVGTRLYSPPLKFYNQKAALQCVEVKLRPVKLFGIVPGLPWRNVVVAGVPIPKDFCPPWIVAYLLIAIPFVSIIKWLFRIL